MRVMSERGGLAVGVLAATACLLTAGGPGLAVAYGPPVYMGTVGEYSPARGSSQAQRPHELQSGGDFYYASIRWTHWGAPVSRGSGRYWAAGAPGIRVSLTASTPQRCGGRLVYTRLSVNDRGAVIAARFERFYCRFKL